MIQGNERAFTVLCDYYNNLPPAENLEDIHWKIIFWRSYGTGKMKKHCLIALFKN